MNDAVHTITLSKSSSHEIQVEAYYDYIDSELFGVSVNVVERYKNSSDSKPEPYAVRIATYHDDYWVHFEDYREQFDYWIKQGMSNNDVQKKLADLQKEIGGQVLGVTADNVYLKVIVSVLGVEVGTNYLSGVVLLHDEDIETQIRCTVRDSDMVSEAMAEAREHAKGLRDELGAFLSEKSDG